MGWVYLETVDTFGYNHKQNYDPGDLPWILFQSARHFCHNSKSPSALISPNLTLLELIR